jgi:O-antigen/teichoic acid export membrane protein
MNTMDQSKIIKGSHLKSIVRHGSLYMISSFLVKSANAFLLPVYTRYLEPAEYAVFSNLMAIGAIAAIFISLYLDSAYARLFFDVEHDRRQLRSLFSTIFLFFLSWGVLAAVAAFFIIRHRTSRLLDVPWYPYILLTCIIPLVMQMNSLARVHFRSQHKSGTVAGAGLAGFAVGAAVSIILLVWGRLGAQSLLWGVLARACVIWLWYYGVLIREGLIGWDFSFKFLREGLTFSLALLPMGTLGWLSGSFDKLLITWFGSMADSGIYSVAFEVGRIMNIFVLSLFMVYGPMIFAMLKEDAKKHIARIEQFQSFYFHAIVGLGFFISIFSPELFQFFVDEKYHGGIVLVPVIAFGFVFGGIRKLYATLIYYHKLTLLISIGTIMASLLRFGLNIVLIPYFAGKAAAWTSLGAAIFLAGYFYLLSRKYEPLRLDRRATTATLSILAVCLMLVGLCTYVLHLSFWPLLSAKIAIAVLAIVLTWFSQFGRELRRVLSRYRDRKSLGIEEPQEPYDLIPKTEED